MEIIVERCAALDVHKDTVMAAVRLPGDRGKRRRTELKEFRTWTSSLRELRSWLVGHGVTQVAMEATGVYWKAPVRHEAPSNREEVQRTPLAGRRSGSLKLGAA